jgi:hypothetical protein
MDKMGPIFDIQTRHRMTEKISKMHSAIFVATSAPQREEWFDFLNGADRNEKIKLHAERFADGVWLVHFRDCPAALSFLICAAESKTISYRLLAFPDAPQWIPVDSSPLST